MLTTITLDSETQRFIDELVRDGRFATPADVVAAAIARLRLDPIDRLDIDDWKAIAQSEAQIDGGHVRDFSNAAAELRRRKATE